MSFTPFARYRNFTLANLKALLEVYPDMARSIPWEEAKDFAEANLKGYKRTAYQQACQPCRCILEITKASRKLQVQCLFIIERYLTGLKK